MLNHGILLKCLLQMKVKHYQHYLYKTSIFATYIYIQTQRTKGNLAIVVVIVRTQEPKLFVGFPINLTHCCLGSLAIRRA